MVTHEGDLVAQPGSVYDYEEITGNIYASGSPRSSATSTPFEQRENMSTVTTPNNCRAGPVEVAMLTSENYHADRTHVSHTQLESFRECRSDYHDRYVTGTMPLDPPTEEMQLGSAVHAMIFEPDCYESLVVVAPEAAPDGKRWLRRKDSDHEKWWSEWEASAVGKICLTAEKEAMVVPMVKAIFSHPIISQAFRDRSAVREKPIRWDHESIFESGCEIVAIRAKPDILLPNMRLRDGSDREDLPLVFDLKTSSVLGDWFRTAGNRGYHRQASLYLEGCQIEYGQPYRFLNIVCRSTAPHRVGVYELGGESINLGFEENNRTIEELARCRLTGIWQTRAERDVEHGDIPAYHFRRDR